MGTSPCSLPVAVLPKESVKGHKPGVHGFGQGPPCWKVQCRQDMRGHEPWTSRGRWEKKMVGLVSTMSSDHEFVCMAVQANLPQEALGLGCPARRFCFTRPAHSWLIVFAIILPGNQRMS